MRKYLFQILTLVVVGCAVLLSVVLPGQANFVEGRPIVVVNPPVVEPVNSPIPKVPTALPKLPTLLPVRKSAPTPPDSLLSTACGIRPELPNQRVRPDLSPVRERLPLSRFRQTAPVTGQIKVIEPRPYQPREEIALAHPTNFGQRFLQDINGQSVQNDAVVVLHENVGSAASTISYFQTPHPNDDDQISYHTLIKRDGTVTYMVPPDKRAFGAGNSIFVGPQGGEAVKTNPKFPASVNNFAYHISLVTPPDGLNNSRRHSGYTQAQYQSLAWLVAKVGVPDDRITTHQKVDRSNQRMDPRSFNQAAFLNLLATYPKTNEISIACTPPQ